MRRKTTRRLGYEMRIDQAADYLHVLTRLGEPETEARLKKGETIQIGGGYFGLNSPVNVSLSDYLELLKRTSELCTEVSRIGSLDETGFEEFRKARIYCERKIKELSKQPEEEPEQAQPEEDWMRALDDRLNGSPKAPVPVSTEAEGTGVVEAESVQEPKSPVSICQQTEKQMSSKKGCYTSYLLWSEDSEPFRIGKREGSMPPLNQESLTNGTDPEDWEGIIEFLRGRKRQYVDKPPSESGVEEIEGFREFEKPPKYARKWLEEFFRDLGV